MATEPFGQSNLGNYGEEHPMRSDTVEPKSLAPVEPQDSAKRRQILDGAHAVFLSRGFDGASMGEIAREAGVSKGTLYVYFDSKEKLFEAIAHEACGVQAETVFCLDPADRDVEAVLTRLGRGFVDFFCRPGAMSPLRTVIAISERMPEIGTEFYKTGPAEGVRKLRLYLEAQALAGVLEIEDCEIAAAQFLDSCVATILKPLLFNVGDAPTDARRDHVVKIAVRAFLAAYRRPTATRKPRLRASR
jgi:AcrR family transcriptional regulator